MFNERVRKKKIIIIDTQYATYYLKSIYVIYAVFNVYAR